MIVTVTVSRKFVPTCT